MALASSADSDEWVRVGRDDERDRLAGTDVGSTVTVTGGLVGMDFHCGGTGVKGGPGHTRPLDLGKIVADTESHLEKLPDLPQDCIKNILMGRSDAGKSTTLCWLNGEEMELRAIKVEVNGRTEYDETLVPRQLPANIVIGSDPTSATRQITLHSDYVDTPGFFDTDGEQKDIVLAVAMFAALRKCHAFRPIVVINIEDIFSSNGDNCKDLLRVLDNLFNPLDQYAQDIVWLFSHAKPTHSVKKLAGKLSSHMRTCQDSASYSPGVVAAFDAMLAFLDEHEEKVLLTVEMMQGPSDAVREVIETCQPLDGRTSVSFPLSEKGLSRLLEACRMASFSVSAAANRGQFEQTLPHLENLQEVVDKTNVEGIKKVNENTLLELKGALSRLEVAALTDQYNDAKHTGDVLRQLQSARRHLSTHQPSLQNTWRQSIDALNGWVETQKDMILGAAEGCEQPPQLNEAAVTRLRHLQAIIDATSALLLDGREQTVGDIVKALEERFCASNSVIITRLDSLQHNAAQIREAADLSGPAAAMKLVAELCSSAAAATSQIQTSMAVLIAAPLFADFVNASVVDLVGQVHSRVAAIEQPAAQELTPLLSASVDAPPLPTCGKLCSAFWLLHQLNDAKASANASSKRAAAASAIHTAATTSRQQAQKTVTRHQFDEALPPLERLCTLAPCALLCDFQVDDVFASLNTTVQQLHAAALQAVKSIASQGKVDLAETLATHIRQLELAVPLDRLMPIHRPTDAPSFEDVFGNLVDATVEAYSAFTDVAIETLTRLVEDAAFTQHTSQPGVAVGGFSSSAFPHHDEHEQAPPYSAVATPVKAQSADAMVRTDSQRRVTETLVSSASVASPPRSFATPTTQPASAAAATTPSPHPDSASPLASPLRHRNDRDHASVAAFHQLEALSPLCSALPKQLGLHAQRVVSALNSHIQQLVNQVEKGDDGTDSTEYLRQLHATYHLHKLAVEFLPGSGLATAAFACDAATTTTTTTTTTATAAAAAASSASASAAVTHQAHRERLFSCHRRVLDAIAAHAAGIMSRVTSALSEHKADELVAGVRDLHILSTNAPLRDELQGKSPGAVFVTVRQELEVQLNQLRADAEDAGVEDDTVKLQAIQNFLSALRAAGLQEFLPSADLERWLHNMSTQSAKTDARLGETVGRLLSKRRFQRVKELLEAQRDARGAIGSGRKALDDANTAITEFLETIPIPKLGRSQRRTTRSVGGAGSVVDEEQVKALAESLSTFQQASCLQELCRFDIARAIKECETAATATFDQCLKQFQRDLERFNFSRAHGQYDACGVLADFFGAGSTSMDFDQRMTVAQDVLEQLPTHIETHVRSCLTYDPELATDDSTLDPDDASSVCKRVSQIAEQDCGDLDFGGQVDWDDVELKVKSMVRTCCRRLLDQSSQLRVVEDHKRSKVALLAVQNMLDCSYLSPAFTSDVEREVDNQKHTGSSGAETKLIKLLESANGVGNGAKIADGLLTLKRTDAPAYSAACKRLDEWFQTRLPQTDQLVAEEHGFAAFPSVFANALRTQVLLADVVLHTRGGSFVELSTLDNHVHENGTALVVKLKQLFQMCHSICETRPEVCVEVVTKIRDGAQPVLNGLGSAVPQPTPRTPKPEPRPGRGRTPNRRRNGRNRRSKHASSADSAQPTEQTAAYASAVVHGRQAGAAAATQASGSSAEHRYADDNDGEGSDADGYVSASEPNDGDGPNDLFASASRNGQCDDASLVMAEEFHVAQLVSILQRNVRDLLEDAEATKQVHETLFERVRAVTQNPLQPAPPTWSEDLQKLCDMQQSTLARQCIKTMVKDLEGWPNQLQDCWRRNQRRETVALMRAAFELSKVRDPKLVHAAQWTNLKETLLGCCGQMSQQLVSLFDAKNFRDLNKLVEAAEQVDKEVLDHVPELEQHRVMDALCTRLAALLRDRTKALPKRAPTNTLAATLVELVKHTKHVTSGRLSQVVKDQIDAIVTEHGDLAQLHQLGQVLNERHGPEGREIVKMCSQFESVVVAARNQATKSMTLPHAIESLRRLNSDGKTLSEQQIEVLQEQYAMFDKVFEAHLRQYLFAGDAADSLEPLIEKTKSLVPQSPASSQRHRGGSYSDIRQVLPELLAGVLALWSITKSRQWYSKLQKEEVVLRPHVIQVLAIFRLLGVDGAKGLLESVPIIGKWAASADPADALCQVSTGEGKSVLIGALATTLALLGYSVDCACYATHLSRRDFESFKPVFQSFGVLEHIKYATLKELCEGAVNTPANIRDAVANLVRGAAYRVKTRKGKERPRILILDEIDVMFEEQFYGSTYNPAARLDDEAFQRVLRQMWQGRRGLVSTNSLELQAALAQFPHARHLLQNEFVQAAADLKRFESQSYKVINGKIGHLVDGEYCTSTNYGYKTMWLYQKECEAGTITRATADAHLGLSVRCGSFAFAKLLKLYRCTLGVSGTLACLSPEAKALMPAFKHNNVTVMPSLFGDPSADYKNHNLDFKPQEHIRIVSTQSDVHQHIATTVRQLHQSGPGRPVLVFFRNEVELCAFRDSEYAQAIRVSFCVTEEMSADASELSNRVSMATKRGQVSLWVSAFGRGTDFESLDDDMDAAGGPIVIQAFFSPTASEDTQMKGRAARQCRKGAFRVLVDAKSLEKSIGMTAATAQGLVASQDIPALLAARQEHEKKGVLALQRAADNAARRHEQSERFRTALFSGADVHPLISELAQLQ